VVTEGHEGGMTCRTSCVVAGVYGVESGGSVRAWELWGRTLAMDWGLGTWDLGLWTGCWVLGLGAGTFQRCVGAVGK
jgi:hypothetical protein